MTIKCMHCLDSGSKCSHCLSIQQFISIVETAAYQAASEGKVELESALNNILKFLPNEPVMAVLEAECSEQISDNLVLLLREQFNIRKWA